MATRQRVVSTRTTRKRVDTRVTAKQAAAAAAATPRTVYRTANDSSRGPVHARYPEINVARTAEAFGVSKSQLSRLLSGKNRPSMKSAVLLSQILGKSVEEVVGLYGEKDSTEGV